MADAFDQPVKSGDTFDQPLEPQGFLENLYGHSIGAYKNLVDTVFDSDKHKDPNVSAWLQTPGANIIKGLAHTVADQYQRGQQAMGEGRYGGAAAHAIATPLPFLSGYANMSEQIDKGDTTGALGAFLGESASFLGPELLKGVPKALNASAKASYSKLWSDVNVPKGLVRSAEGGAQELAAEKPIASGLQEMRDKVKARKEQVGAAAKDAYVGKDPMPVQPLLDELNQQQKERSLVRDAQGNYTLAHTGAAPIWDRIESIKDDLLHDRTVDPSTGKVITTKDSTWTDPKTGQKVISAVTLDDRLNKIQQHNVNSSGVYSVPENTESLHNVDDSMASILKKHRDTAYPEEVPGQEAYGSWTTVDKLLNMLQEGEIKKGFKLGKLATPTFATMGAATAYGLHYSPLQVPMGPALGIGAGAYASLEGLRKAMNTVKWKTVSGATKAHIADAMSKHDFTRAGNIVNAVKAGLTEQSNEQ